MGVHVTSSMDPVTANPYDAKTQRDEFLAWDSGWFAGLRDAYLHGLDAPEGAAPAGVRD